MPGQRVPLLVWYPTSQASRPTQFGPCTLDVAPGASPAGGRHRLAMIPHGTAGDPLAHAHLAIDLARRGYVAAGPRHAKDNARDWSGVGTYEVWYGRPRQISEGIDAILADATLGPVTDPGPHGGHRSLGRRLHRVGARRRPRRHEPSPVTLRATFRRWVLPGPGGTNAGGRSGRTNSGRARRAHQGGRRAGAAGDLLRSGLARHGRCTSADLRRRARCGPARAVSRRAAPSDHQAHARVRPGQGRRSLLLRRPFPEAVKQQVGDAATDSPGFDRAAFQEQLRREIAAFLDRALR